MRVMHYLIDADVVPKLMRIEDDPNWVSRQGEWVLLDGKVCEVTSIYYTPQGTTEESKHHALVQIMTKHVALGYNSVKDLATYRGY